MSRIDLKAFGGRLSNDHFLNCVPDNEDLYGEELEGNIDAVNDETFGGDFDDDIMDDDLEQYSKQTASLHLEDESPKWFEEPGCSISAPDPSELPAPPFGFDSVSSADASSASYDENLSSLRMQLGTTDSLWKNVDATTMCWSDQELSAEQKTASNFPSRVDSNGTSFIEVLQNHNLLGKNSTENDGLYTLAALPKNALTLEEIERNHHTANNSELTATSIQPTISGSPVTLAELERRLLDMGNRTAVSSVPKIDLPPNVPPPSDSLAPQLMNPPPFSHPPPYLPFPLIPPFAMLIMRAHIFGQLPELPPGFPPITPQMRAALLALGPPPLPQMASNSMLLPFNYTQQPNQMRPAQLTEPPHLIYPAQSQINPPIIHTVHHRRNHTRDRLNRRVNLPSNKTISDFALSPFAGFVSKKEREWLIKIQQLQCQGCGNSYEDDFYYTTWKQRKTAQERHKNGLEPDVRHHFLLNAATAHHYVPPTFAGSLGKPTISTVNNPRHLIDLSSSDSLDDDDKLSMRSRTSQKKLRAVLLQLENVALLIIECDEKQRILCTSSLPDEIQRAMKDGIEYRLKTIIHSVCSNERLQTVLLINKGRRMFARTLSLANEEQQLYLLHSFFAALATVAKRVRANEMNESLLVPLFETFSRFSSSVLTNFVQDLKLISAVDVTTNLFITNLLILLLVCCSRKDCRLDAEFFCGTILSSLLRSCSHTVECTLEHYITLSLADIKLLDVWSAQNMIGYGGSIAEKLIHNLQLTCKVHESDMK